MKNLLVFSALIFSFNIFAEESASKEKAVEALDKLYGSYEVTEQKLYKREGSGTEYVEDSKGIPLTRMKLSKTEKDDKSVEYKLDLSYQETGDTFHTTFFEFDKVNGEGLEKVGQKASVIYRQNLPTWVLFSYYPPGIFYSEEEKKDPDAKYNLFGIRSFEMKDGQLIMIYELIKQKIKMEDGVLRVVGRKASKSVITLRKIN
jgi:hypothetical protein